MIEQDSVPLSSANAFRARVARFGYVWLEFCDYNAVSNTAELVARVEVPQQFLPLIVDQLQQVWVDLQGLDVDGLEN